MGESKRYFEISDGKFREKILGVKLMESTSYPFEQQKRALQDVGDTSLLLCGYFFESINKKIVDVGYYRRLGQTAYKRLNSIVPDVYDIPSFYSLLSNAFDDIVTMISVIAKEFNAKDFDRDFSFCLTPRLKWQVKALFARYSIFDQEV